MTNKNQKYYLLGAIAAILLIASFFVSNYYANKPGNYDEFAICIEKSGAKFYGAFWCPHCQTQKALFGKSKDKLPYVECSTANGQEQTQQCKDNKIESYPTWEFLVNGTTTRMTGEQSFEDLAKITNCPLPAGYVAETKKEVATGTPVQIQNIEISTSTVK
jgi:thiol-disulfide isomerase/thioredoxin